MLYNQKQMTDCIFLTSLYNFLKYFVWLRVIDEGSVPEMRIWTMLLITTDLKWCIHLGRSLFLNYIHFKKLFCSDVLFSAQRISEA